LGPWELPTPDICMALAEFPKNSTPVEEFQQLFLEHRHQADIQIYTDGSKSVGGVGAGLVSMAHRERDHVIARRVDDSASIASRQVTLLGIETVPGTLTNNHTGKKQLKTEFLINSQRQF